MDEERRQWLRRVADAARLAAEELREVDDTYHRGLTESLDALHARLTAELATEDESR